LTFDNIDVDASLANIRELLKVETSTSPALRAAIEVLVMLVTILVNRLAINSKNSSKPPSFDPNRARKPKSKSARKPGGQDGHDGVTLQPVDDPDEVKRLTVDRAKLLKGTYRYVGFEKRQVIDIDIRRFVVEYQAEILEDAHGNRIIASFPNGVDRQIQYGNGIKAHAVYLSQYQLLPYNRIEEYFRDQLQIPLSAGSLFNFNREASCYLAPFDAWVREELTNEPLLHVDETGINIGGKRHWLHCTSNERLTFFYPHAKRGTEAMNEIGILPKFRGFLCHDHWKPYFSYDCFHALCNSHHVRELQFAFERDGQHWAQTMQDLLLECNQAVNDAGGLLTTETADAYRQRYHDILQEATTECPPPDKPQQGRKGRIKRSKSRNLLERLRDFETETLRFMVVKEVPFTNNQGENDIRMTKVHQKISGCFRSMEGAIMFCRIRSYLSTCRKQNVSATDALRWLFEGRWPDFMTR